MKSTLLTIFIIFAGLQSIFAQSVTYKSTVVDADSKVPLSNVTVKLTRNNSAVQTDAQGHFEITANSNDSLQISLIGYKTAIIKVESLKDGMTIELTSFTADLDEVYVVSTGYQQLPKERATGSFQQVDNELLNRSVSTNVLDRLENVVSGLVFNKGDAANTDAFLIRGRSTITADAQPLIVIDDFPYDGDLNNINPNTIESVTILRDAAAASIWGARAGNGVIVITTKKGTATKPKVQLTTNMTFQNKPDLSNISVMSSADRIAWERFLYESGHYESAELGNTLVSRANPIPQAVELMIVNPTDLEEQLSQLATHNVYDDLSNYFYRPAFNQQHNLSVAGNAQNLSYLFSAGYDKNAQHLVGSSYNRINLRSANQYRFSNRLRADVSILYTQSNDTQGGNDGLNISSVRGLSPYARLVGDNGEALPYFHNHRESFLETVGQGNLMDWYYRPYDEINLRSNTDKVRDMLLNTGFKYAILDGLSAELKYQYQNQLGNMRDVSSPDSYSARYLVNRFSRINPNGSVTYIVPSGGTLQSNAREVQSHQGRMQLNYSKNWKHKHDVNAIAGYEIRSRVTTDENTFRFGYDEEFATVNPIVDLVTWHPVLDSDNVQQIPAGDNNVGKYTDNFLSYYFNGAYSYDNKYTLSASLRKDEANLFGVNANMKGTPLWSIGTAWILSNESFMNQNLFSLLKIRATYGVNGNISRLASANTVTQKAAGGNTHNYPTQSILTPPNRNLRWEKVKVFNIGLDFGIKNNRLNGTIEYYDKRSEDLLAQAPTDPTLGFETVYANVASMSGKGVDINLNSVNIQSSLFNWQTTLLYSYAENKVTDYHMPPSSIASTYITSLSSITPVLGNPLYSAYSYHWAGLNEVGDPQIFVDGEIVDDYNVIYNTLPLEQIQYHGSVQPTHYGALRNTFQYRNFGFSFNISYKLGYYFRTPTMFNSGLISGWTGHGDFANRWQNPGDELLTHVPSVIYPANTLRDNVYQYSSLHIHRADNIRLEDFNLYYDFVPNKKTAFTNARIFLYVSELGSLWYKNKVGVDPYYNNTPLQRKRISIGANINF